ncbi:nucleotide disphospho-sugar-binding domain-containing protein [Actinoplanes solisilvae]|uniref:nucleotide disphospho-sugar-binding domain-containing protein n=1 Tax=Actinoplanes solisilvae TaxID=2486853 RepID=UPI0013E3CD5F|nr:nucleotide disphospho-sugar-binding domain-containing protein [Actinoplanes solisilvae]
MRILTATIDAGGNTPPTVAITAELIRRGHEVLVLGHGSQRAAFAATGQRLREWSSARTWSPRADHPDLRTMLSWLPLASDPGYGRDIAAAVGTDRVDLVLTDCMIPGALRQIRATGVPVAMLVHAYSGYWRTQWSRKSPMGTWLRLTGAHPGRRGALPDRLVVTTLPQLDVIPQDRGLLPAPTVQTGPVFGSAPTSAARADGDAPLLISLSTISYPGQQACLQRILDAFDGMPVRAVATVGTSVNARGLRPPSNVTVRAFASHTEMMPRMSAIIGHGGHGTTMLALAHGLPVLMFPQSGHTDQPLVAASVAAAGAGLTLPRETEVAQIRSSILRLITDRELRRRAARLGEQLRAVDGATAAASALESLVKEKAGP